MGRGILGLFGWFLFAWAMYGCSAWEQPGAPRPVGEPAPARVANITSTYTPFLPVPLPLASTPSTVDRLVTLTISTPTAMQTAAMTQTATPIPTATLTPTPTPTWAYSPPGVVIAPILLYHHVDDIDPPSRYYVSPADFRWQMQALRDWGYTTITPTLLIDVLINGGELPARPVIITFDDGNRDVYSNAYPIMQAQGFVGAIYVVTNQIGLSSYIGVEGLGELYAAGWEIGSHGKSHIDLSKDHDAAYAEMVDSRRVLTETLGVPVLTFSYPYGATDDFVFEQLSEAGYSGGMGLGGLWRHFAGHQNYLSRCEVRGDMDLAAFAALLPWYELPTTATPTPSATP
jgi:peptidoglycan/xylan/chitin deacetylase (PgdA/CDA1 family)